MIQQKIYVGADALVFSKTGGELQLLLIKRGNDPYKGQWAFPGGFVEDDEELEAGALRELEEETGLKLPSMVQLGAFGRVDRDPRFRCISVAHYAIVDAAQHKVQGGDDAAEAHWVNVKDIDKLAFDHGEILEYALEILAWELEM
jgi:8-oxo-dGTP diphosphatase